MRVHARGNTPLAFLPHSQGWSVFDKAGLWFLCGRMKAEVIEYEDVVYNTAHACKAYMQSYFLKRISIVLLDCLHGGGDPKKVRLLLPSGSDIKCILLCS